MKTFIFSLRYSDGVVNQTFLSKFNSYKAARHCLNFLHANYDHLGIESIRIDRDYLYVPSFNTAIIIAGKSFMLTEQGKSIWNNINYHQ